METWDDKSASDERSGLRARGEEAVGELAQALLENPLLSAALGRALGAGERAASAQRSAIGALNLASASDIERLEQRLRSLSGRLEELEDRLDEIADDLAAMGTRPGPPGARAADQTAGDVSDRSG
jgi:chromosome segregation ATPase